MQGCSGIDSDYSQIHFTNGCNIPGFSEVHHIIFSKMIMIDHLKFKLVANS